MIIRALAYTCMVLGALGVAVVTGGHMYLLGPALTLFVAGCLLLALDRVITLLTEIRDAARDLTPEAAARREAGAKMDKYL